MMTIARLAFVVLMLAVARDADACQCMESGPPCQSFFEVQAVFAGTVKSVAPAERTSTGPDEVRVEFEDAVAFRGVQGPSQTVLTTSPDGTRCAFDFKPGERYVVYAYRSKPGAPLRTTICSPTKKITEAAEDLLFFKSLASSSGSPRVFGSVTHRETGTIDRDGNQYGPVAHVWLALRNDTATYRASTDVKGRYELTGVPPATYELTIEPPQGLTPYERPKQTLTLADRLSCAERNFELRFDSRVRGSLRQSMGQPAAGVRVQLIRIEYIDRKGPVDTIDTTSDADGAFEFSEVSSGSYVLGVDILRAFGMSPDSDVVFPPTYHPGTSDASRATVVDIRGGEGQDLTHEGLSYIISAYDRLPNTRGVRPITTDVGPFLVTKELAPLHLVVTPTR